jgi:hypothetical protein
MAGYLLGATARVLLVAAINFFVGLFTGSAGGMSVHSWVMFNAVMVGFSITVWCLVLFLAFQGAMRSFWVTTIFVGIGFMSRGILLAVVPALVLLCAPLQGRTVFSFGLGPANDAESYIISQAFQWAFALLFIKAAARKYGKQDALAFSFPAAMVALYLWVGASVIGLMLNDKMRTFQFFRGDEDMTPMFTGAIVSTMLVALVAVASAAWTAVLRERKRPGRGAVDQHWRFVLCVVMMLAGLLVMVSVPLHLTTYTFGTVQTTVHGHPSYNYQTTTNHHLMVMVGSWANRGFLLAAAGLTLAQAYVMMRGLYPRMQRANWVIAFVGAFLWIGPLLVDLFHTIATSSRGPQPLRFSLASSLGAVIAACQGPVERKWMIGGLIFQAGVLVAFWMMFGLAKARRARRRAQMILPVAVAEPMGAV